MDAWGRTSAPHAGEDMDGQRSIGDILKGISHGIQEIVRFEIKLAKIEVQDSASKMKASSVFLASGAILGIFAVGFILLAAMFALAIVLPAWLAALILGVLLLIGAAAAMSVGRNRLKAVHAPELTMQTVKEDVEWMKEQARS
jgi:uncharacterized membrane protein YqjE